MNNGTGVHRSALSATACHKQDPGYQGSAARCRCPSASARDGLATPCAAVPQRSVGEVWSSPSGAMIHARLNSKCTSATLPARRPLKSSCTQWFDRSSAPENRCIAWRITVINNRYNNMR